jgi:hypothetical protein
MSVFWQSVLASALVFGAGCVSPPAKSPTDSATVPQKVPAPAPPARPSPKEILKAAAAQPSAPFEGESWVPLFDGKTLTNWHETDFAGHGDVECLFGLLVLNMGDPFTGVNWTNHVPTMSYEVALDAMRVAGSDFFCGLTVPVGDSFCSLIVGGWGGSLVGISSLDHNDASENETTKFVNFEQARWYRIRLRVTPDRIEGWIDKDKLVDVVTTGKRISLRPGDIELSKPFGLAAWQSTAAFREIKMRRVSEPADPPKRY